MTIMVTGGAGFIGANFVLDWFASCDEKVVTLDARTYAGNRSNLSSLDHDARHVFVRGSIGDRALVMRLLEEHDVRAVVNIAAESHVDRSISSPGPFLETNVMGTVGLLEAAWCHAAKRDGFRILHVSTDKVYGTLEQNDLPFAETNPYKPNSPYEASNAAWDHVVRAYHETFGLPVLVTNCSNNYGPRQFPEKLIPLITHNALAGKALPVYGDGLQVRDWLYVSDHCAALRQVLASDQLAETYNVGGNKQETNLEVVSTLCALLDGKRPKADGTSYAAQVTHVTDHPGHDRRYAIDATKIERELGWRLTGTPILSGKAAAAPELSAVEALEAPSAASGVR